MSKKQNVAWVGRGKTPLRIGHITGERHGITSIIWDVKNPSFLPLYSNFSKLEVKWFADQGLLIVEDR